MFRQEPAEPDLIPQHGNGTSHEDPKDHCDGAF